MPRGAMTRDPSRDDGFTLIELMVSIGIFGILMAMVSVIVINGMGSLRTATTGNTVQAEQQNAMLVTSRLVRYIDNPVNSGVPPAAILQATPTSLAFFTLSGTGNVDRLPYKVMLCTTQRGVESFTWAPALVNGAAVPNANPNMSVPTCNDAGAVGAMRRVLLQNAQDTQPSMAFRYWRARTVADGIGTGDIEILPSGSLTTAQLALLSSVTIVLSDPSLGGSLEQTVVLANER